jgi:non-canonical purine NTP pyrophosphatase (RdgB/HAM1 family)
MIKLLLASNNKGKYDELVGAFEAVGIELIYDGELNLVEDSPTLELNAITKAQAASAQRNMFSMSDDTGFFIPALDGFPGVHANRWMPGDWKAKRDAILKMVEGKADRRAFLLSKFAVCTPSGKIIGQHEVKNWYEIGFEDHVRQGHETFGYNPILIMQGYHIGDLTNEQRYFLKNRGRHAAEVKEELLREFASRLE